MDALIVDDGEKRYPCHSCGHSIQTAVMAYVLKMLNDMKLCGETGGRVNFIAAPAEEFIEFEYRQKLRAEGKIKYFSGKQNMIEQGIFDDVDCVISMHVNGETGEHDVRRPAPHLAGFTGEEGCVLPEARRSFRCGRLIWEKMRSMGPVSAMDAIAYMKDQFPG